MEEKKNSTTDDNHSVLPEVAHGFNNVLGAIKGYAEQLKKKRGQEDDIGRYAEKIVEACEKGAGLAANFAGKQVDTQEIDHLSCDSPAPRIMMVDDDEMLIDMFRDVFKEIGVPNILFTSGFDAVEYYRKHVDEIDIAVIDMIMPVMGGTKLFNELRSINHCLPVIVLSGYASGREIDALVKQGAYHLSKPVEVDVLIEQAKQMISAQSGRVVKGVSEVVEKLDVVVVDDDQLFGGFLLDILHDYRLSVRSFTDPRVFLEFINSGSLPTLALIDYKMPHINGFELIRKVRRVAPSVKEVLITGVVGSEELAFEAAALEIKCLSKPLDTAELRTILEQHFTLIEDKTVTDSEKRGHSKEMLVGTSVAIIRTRELIRRVAKSEANLLVYGETGSGKELAARMIHNESNRKERAFIPVNCPALPDNLLESELFGYEKGSFTGAHQTKLGLFEWADMGTIFLDEIGDLNYALQAKLLRAIQEKKIRRIGGQKEISVNVRIISATNKNLEAMVREKTFREDLYYRLSAVRIVLPPLRERKEDIPHIVRHFIQRHNNREPEKRIADISLEAINGLKHYGWPGNVRELENVINEAIMTTSGARITVRDIPEYIKGNENISGSIKLLPTSLSDYVNNAKKEYVAILVKKHGGNVSAAAKEAEVNRASFHRLLSQYRIDPNDYRHRQES